VVAYTDPLTVTVPDDAMPATVKVPALAVIDPARKRSASVTVAVDVMPATVKVPALAVIDPK
jgi:hypothetical protein